ncbi:MAG: hypothetical protein O7A67_00790 [SAR324 cluster bacterium]|nr:hypothetical protein [SAR324 cluster bacterium]
MRLKVILCHPLSALKRLAQPADSLTARPKRLRFLRIKPVGRVIRHARQTLLRLTSALARQIVDGARNRIQTLRPPLPAQ